MKPDVTAQAIPAAEEYRPQGFTELLHDAILSAQRCSTLKAAVDTIATLGRRVDIGDAYNCFTRVEKAIIEAQADTPVFPFLDGILDLSRDAVYLGVSKYGRTRIFTGRTRPGDVIVFAKTVLAAELLEWEDPDLIGNEALVAQFYDTYTREDVPELLDCAFHAIDHIDPVILYVHYDTYTNHENFNNLLGKGGKRSADFLLTELATRDLESWTQNERTLIASIWLLSKSMTRVEEFNGQQLTLVIVEEFLREKYRRLLACLDAEPEDCELLELPERIGEARRKIRPKYFAYRLINGLTLNKHEHYALRSVVDLSLSRVPEPVAGYIESEHGVRRSDHASIDGYFGAVVENLDPDGEADARGLTPLERLLEKLVTAAIAETSSDIGMSRGVRDWLQWRNLFAEQRYEEICRLPLSSYFCAVFASDGARRALLDQERGTYQKILSAIAGRMTFNSWHYTPGHCPLGEVPKDRHFYTPPAMSDTADWSDKHHQGHVFAQVRYSIRSPGGLFVNDVKQRGLFDIRLMRMWGRPYTLQELFRCREFTAYVRAIHQAALGASVATRRPHVIRSFTKDWYKRV